MTRILPAILAMALSVAVLCARLQLGRFAVQIPPDAVLTDPIAKLQSSIDAGEVELEFGPERGYLDAVLETLGVPAASQSLVFSKTSFQAAITSPDNPRALYFNDDVYLGWIPGSPVLEVVTVDPTYGTVFYTLDQERPACRNSHSKGAVVSTATCPPGPTF